MSTRYRPLAAAVAAVACLALVVTAQPLRLKSGNSASSKVVSHTDPASEIRDARRFVFDNGFSGSPGLSFHVDRPVPTRDWSGSLVASDEPRFAPRTSIAGTVSLQTVRASSRASSILGSGLDHDGVTPLLVLIDLTANALDVFVGADDALMQAEATGVGRVRTTLGAGGDIMGGTVTNRRYNPRAGVVCHGLIVLHCAVSRQPVPPNSAWNVGASAIIVSQDRGQTWTVAFADAIVQENRDRGREWSMQNWWPATTDAAPLDAYFASADYRSKPGTTGGRAYGFRATRVAVGEPWSIDIPTMFYETPVLGSGQHAHTAGIFPTPGGLRAVIALGDTQAFNRIVTLDRSSAEVAPTGWTANESFHGSMSTSGNQFVGLAPGPSHGLMIAGSDLCYEQLMLLDATGPVAHHTHLYGGPWSDGRNGQNFVIRTPTPERAGPYIATYDPQSASDPFPPQCRRILYSENGIDWAQAFAPESGSQWAAIAHGSHIYIDADSVSLLGIRRVDRPIMHTARPLHVGPGAMQRLVAAPTITPFSGGTVTALTQDGDGLWTDAGVPLDPQPPCNGPVWKMTGFAGATDTRIGDLYPIASPTMGQTLGTSRLAGRIWLLNAMESKAMTPRFELKPSGSSTLVTRGANANTTASWVPIDFALDAPMPAGQRPVIRVRSGSAADVQAFYLATDVFAEGAGFAGYPAPPDTSLGLTGTALPDEHARVEGLNPSATWTVTLAGMVPQDGWDLATPVTPDERWPLASIVAPGAERITFYADSAAHTLEADIVRDGSLIGRFRLDGVVWTRNSPLLVSVARAGPLSDLSITAAPCATQPREMVRVDGLGGVATMLASPDRIRFDDGTGIDGIGAEIRCAPMLWFGGEIHEDLALDQATRRQRLRSLDWLTGP